MSVEEQFNEKYAMLAHLQGELWEVVHEIDETAEERREHNTEAAEDLERISFLLNRAIFAHPNYKLEEES